MDRAYLICQNQSGILSSSDWIALVEIFVTLVFGIIIVTVVQNRFTNNRAVKDFFISECASIKTDYKVFFDQVYRNKHSAKYIQEWFKVMTLKIDSFEFTLKKEFEIYDNLSSKHGKIKKFLTSRTELNEQYREKIVKLTQGSKSELLKEHKQLTTLIAQLIVSINKAKRK